MRYGNWKEISECVTLDFDANAYKAVRPNGRTEFFANEADANDWVAEYINGIGRDGHIKRFSA